MWSVPEMESDQQRFKLYTSSLHLPSIHQVSNSEYIAPYARALRSNCKNNTQHTPYPASNTISIAFFQEPRNVTWHRPGPRTFCRMSTGISVRSTGAWRYQHAGIAERNISTFVSDFMTSLHFLCLRPGTLWSRIGMRCPYHRDFVIPILSLSFYTCASIHLPFV